MLPTLTHYSVYVIDDDPIGRESVAALVRSHGMEVETYESAETFMASFDRAGSGCMVVDMRLPGMSGMELQKRLVQDGISLPIIMITGYADIPSAVQAMRNGALTFLEKPCSDQKLWEAISQALDLEAASRLQRQQRTDIVCRLKTLSGDEHCVLDMLLAGKPNKIIARDLEMGLRTVELRRARILEKMHASSLAELVQMAMLVKLIVAMAQEPSAEGFAHPNEIEATIRSLPDDPIQRMQTAGSSDSPRSEADGT